MIADIYARKSTKDDGRSVADQETDLRRNVAAEGWALGQVFADPDRSASRFVDYKRPGYDQLLAHIESGGCELLAIWESSRGGRRLTEWSALLDLCRQRKVKVWVTTHDRLFDLAKAGDWKALATDGIDSAYESEKISLRTKRGKASTALEGRPIGACPFGYSRTYAVIEGRIRPEKQAEDPVTGPIVRRMFERVAAGDSLRAIVRDLEADAVPTVTGVPWRTATVRSMVLNRRYLGRSTHEGRDVGPAIWPALTDEDTFGRCRDRLTDPRRRTARGSELRYVLSGTLTCSRCGIIMRTYWRDQRCYRCATCYTIIRAEPSEDALGLEELVEATVVARFARKDAISVLTKRVSGADVKAAERHLAGLRRQLDEHIDLAVAHKITAATLARVEQGLVPQIESAQRRLDGLTVPPALAGLDVVNIVRDWPGWTVRKRRDIIRAVVDLVVAPAPPRAVDLDPARLGTSRWVGDELTWHEHGIV